MDEEEKEQRRRIEENWNREAFKKLTDEQRSMVERGWAAGLFDGEGHASARPDGGFNCSIDQVSNDFYNLERFRKVVGVGQVTDLAPRKNPKQRVASRWTITHREELVTLIDVIGPFLTKTKRDQLAAAFMSAKTPLKNAGITVVNVEPKRKSKNSDGDTD